MQRVRRVEEEGCERTSIPVEVEVDLIKSNAAAAKPHFCVFEV